uniref:Uncharacterized protein n=1 Tax=Chromera velia CCMP2878 TaxID=1169474 RepID=A0A0G4I9Q0_9ALVE|eukprot:Cvel_2044.t1-p1 / transcript=Cvel_2044.t1 / gene=Cvel_2044 / organism=Chromera_velia_CCMP2878 / gene_product=Guanine/hypoxanthine permease PbuO, putative / transcript_product=Guanine/hypoxanthine permease PbuO, putative / location=Cvel_scaffold78:115453-119930(+) / protein_length=495 / sequence_SO=supercontig / SO=protein_coding / is_pseudo=false
MGGDSRDYYTNLNPSPSNTFGDRVDRYFKMTERGSSVMQEIKAGVILFATMCYILVVNPEILGAAGLDMGLVASSTAVCAVVGSLIMGLFANLPFGVAPGMGLNTYFAFELVLGSHHTPAQACTICLVAGGIFALLGAVGAANAAINSVPLSMKKAVVVGIGLFQTIIGLSVLGVIQAGDQTILELGDVTGMPQMLGIATLLLIAMLVVLNVPGSILIGMGFTTVVALAIGLTHVPAKVVSTPEIAITVFDWSVLTTVSGWVGIFFVFFVAFVDVGGVMIGIAAQADELIDERTGDVTNQRWGFTIVGLSIMISAVFGNSPMIIYLESAAAVQQGGRTGLTTIVSALLFFVVMFFVPTVSAVPRAATAPVLVLVGSFMMGAVMAVSWDKINEALPAFMTITMMAFTCSISTGLVSGICFYAVLNFPFVLARGLNVAWLKDRLAMEEIQSARQRAASIESAIERKRSEVYSFRERREGSGDVAVHHQSRASPPVFN